MFLAAGHGQLGEIRAARDAIERAESLTGLAVADWAATWRDPVAGELLAEGIALAEGKNAPIQ